MKRDAKNLVLGVVAFAVVVGAVVALAALLGAAPASPWLLVGLLVGHAIWSSERIDALVRRLDTSDASALARAGAHLTALEARGPVEEEATTVADVMISLSREELVALEALAREELMACPACPYEVDGDHPEMACGEHLSLSYARWRLARTIAEIEPSGGADIVVRPSDEGPRPPNFRNVRGGDALPSEYLEGGDVSILYRWLCPSLSREQADALRDKGLHVGRDVGDWRGMQGIIRTWLASRSGS